MAVVLANSYETAREAAHKVGVSYAEERPSAGFDAPGVEFQTVHAGRESHLAEYLVPVNADIRDVQIIMVPEVDGT